MHPLALRHRILGPRRERETDTHTHTWDKKATWREGSPEMGAGVPGGRTRPPSVSYRRMVVGLIPHPRRNPPPQDSIGVPPQEGGGFHWLENEIAHAPGQVYARAGRRTWGQGPRKWKVRPTGEASSISHNALNK